jgi:hypothetical protein
MTSVNPKIYLEGPLDWAVFCALKNLGYFVGEVKIISPESGFIYLADCKGTTSGTGNARKALKDKVSWVRGIGKEPKDLILIEDYDEGKAREPDGVEAWIRWELKDHRDIKKWGFKKHMLEDHLLLCLQKSPEPFNQLLEKDTVEGILAKAKKGGPGTSKDVLWEVYCHLFRTFSDRASFYEAIVLKTAKASPKTLEEAFGPILKDWPYPRV